MQSECPHVGGMMSRIKLPVARALQVRAHKNSRVVRTVNTTKGQLTGDLIAKVECADWQVAGALQDHVHEISRVVRAIDTTYGLLRRSECQGRRNKGQVFTQCHV